MSYYRTTSPAHDQTIASCRSGDSSEKEEGVSLAVAIKTLYIINELLQDDESRA